MYAMYLSEVDFISTLKGEKPEFIQNGRIFIEGYLIDVIRSTKIETKYSIHLENCTFNEFFDLSIKCKESINITDCKFHSTFSILNSECGNFKINDNWFSKAITIDNCSFTALKIDSESENPRLLISKSDFEGFTLSGNKYTDIHILNSFFKDRFLINKANIENLIFSSDKEEKNSSKEEKNSNIVFNDSTFHNEVSFEKGFFGNIQIKNCEFNNFSIVDGKFDAITVNNQDKTFKGIFNVSGGEFKGDFIFNDGIFQQELKFDGGKFKNIIFKNGNFTRVSFNNGSYDGFINIRGGTYDSIIFKGGTFIRYVDFWGRNEKELNEKELNEKGLNEKEPNEKKLDFKIGKINISGGDFKENIWIKDGEINEINIRPVLMSRIHILPSDGNKYQYSAPNIGAINITTYFFKDSFLQINDISLRKLSFSNFTNMATITIANVKIEKEIEITNSDLGKTTFIDCDFSEIDLKFKSSKITDSSVNGTLLPKKIKTQDDLQKRLALSQIKKIYENRGDLVTANEYYAEEMKTYMCQLFTNLKVSQIPEFLNLILNRISNNFGQSWFLALTITIVIVFLSLELFTRSLNFPISNDIWGALKWKMGLIFEYINPTTKIKDFADSLGIKQEKLTSNSKFIFGLTRFVIIPYFVYQLIAAFRKHGKKS